jgi:hypothetical protein
MPRKAKPTADGSRVTFTIRLGPTSGKWLFDRSEEVGQSLTDLVVGFIIDARTWWDVAAEVAAALRDDAKQLDLSQRDYVHYLLERRYEAIRKHGAGWEKNDPAVLLAKRR